MFGVFFLPQSRFEQSIWISCEEIVQLEEVVMLKKDTSYWEWTADCAEGKTDRMEQGY